MSSRTIPPRGSVSSGPQRSGANPLPAPHKRPVQDRAKFTVQAIYDAYVRIWRRDGPDAATTRAVATESGFAVGTLYAYFPNKAALHSGYVRHAMETVLEQIDRDVIAASGQAWPKRLRNLVEITCGTRPDTPYFDAVMLQLEHEIADRDRHQRAFTVLAGKWCEAIAGFEDLHPQPEPELVSTLLLAVWGARRYQLLVSADPHQPPDWTGHLTTLCQRTLSGPPA